MNEFNSLDFIYVHQKMKVADNTQKKTSVFAEVFFYSSQTIPYNIVPNLSEALGLRAFG